MLSQSIKMLCEGIYFTTGETESRDNVCLLSVSDGTIAV